MFLNLFLFLFYSILSYLLTGAERVLRHIVFHCCGTLYEYAYDNKTETGQTSHQDLFAS